MSVKTNNHKLGFPNLAVGYRHGYLKPNYILVHKGDPIKSFRTLIFKDTYISLIEHFMYCINYEK